MPIEQRGVDTIPEEERTSGPRDLISILLGSNLCLGVIVFGWLPPSFGLGLWPSVTAIVTGTLIGIAFTAPLALVSLRTATNLSTSSGAQFGVRGRLVGSVVGLLLSLGYTALTLWIGGDVMVGTLSRLTGLPDTGVSRAAMYGVLAACTVVGAVFGYRLLLRLSKVLSIGMVVLLAVGFFAYAPDFTTAAPPETPYLLGSFWPTWLLAAVAAGLSGPVAFITLLGDYTRYISPRRHGSRKVLWATAFGLLIGLLIPQLFGTYTALAARAGLDYSRPARRERPVLVPGPAAGRRRGRFGGQCRADALLHGPGPRRDRPQGHPHHRHPGRRGRRHRLRLLRLLRVGRAVRDDLLRAAADRDRHPVGRHHPHRVRALPGGLRPRCPPGVQPSGPWRRLLVQRWLEPPRHRLLGGRMRPWDWPPCRPRCTRARCWPSPAGWTAVSSCRGWSAAWCTPR